MKKEEPQKWLRFEDEGWQVVIPDFDIKPHAVKFESDTKGELAGWECPCNPKIDWFSGIIIHNSFRDEEAITKSMKQFS